MKKTILFFVLFVCLAVGAMAAIKILHHFSGGSNDGSTPYDSLICSGNTLYGMTSLGGESDKGAIFKIKTDGTGFALLHEFAGGSNDGQYPYGSLTFSDNTLFGMTSRGGDTDQGTIFKINTDGSSFTLLHEFAGGSSDGQYPHSGSLVLSGNIMYGMTRGGGDSGLGTIFKINSDGTGFTLLHKFSTPGTDDGSTPYGSLIIFSGYLWGMTKFGGDKNIGTIFCVSTDGTNFELLHEFVGGSGDGANPYGYLVYNGVTLLGMTDTGGDSNFGTIFSINTNGSGFSLLHEFTALSDDGGSSLGSLIISGNKLYGMTHLGGESGPGTIFKINTDGTGFILLHSFTGGSNDGKYPYGSLLRLGTDFYGMTPEGGSANLGVIFKMSVPQADLDQNWTSDILWRHYTADGGNTVWLMNPATAGMLQGEEQNEVEGEENKEEGEEITDVGAELVSAQMDAEDGRSPGSPLQDVYESALPEGEGLSTEYPVPEYPGPFGTISVLSNVPLPAIVDTKWKMCGSGDFDGDGQLDILWRYAETGGANAVWLMGGTDKYSAVSLPALAAISWEIMGVGDFNNDSKPDILWRNKGNGKNMVWLMNGLTRTATVNLTTQANLTWKIVGCGDFNGDGKPDILWRFQGTGGKNQVWLMNGTARQSIVNIKAETNLNWKIAGVGDFDKNGRPDIIWRNYATGGANRIWIMNNTAYVRTETLPAVADLNWKIEN